MGCFSQRFQPVNASSVTPSLTLIQGHQWISCMLPLVLALCEAQMRQQTRRIQHAEVPLEMCEK